MTYIKILPKDEIARRIWAMHEDFSTPWTYVRMRREGRFKFCLATLHEAARGKMSETTQMALSKFLLDIETGALRVYYKNPGARRMTQVKNMYGSPERIAAQKLNKVVVERGLSKPVEQNVFSIGNVFRGAKLKPGRKKIHGFDMPGAE